MKTIDIADPEQNTDNGCGLQICFSTATKEIMKIK